MLLQGKRLLHLGAGVFQIASIQAARDLGCFVITTDNIPGNVGHALGDAAEHASTVDPGACLALAQKYRVDGVMTYGSDVSTPAVAYVAEQLGLPGNPYESARILQRKDLVRAFQREHGLPHPEFVVLAAGDDLTERLAGFPFPAVLKPVDSSGSKGISVVNGFSEVRAGMEKALPFSRQGLVVLEQFLTRNLPELDGDVWIRNGRLAFRHYGHNHFSKANGMVPVGEMFPGFYPDAVCAELDRQFTTLIQGLGLRDGCMNFDGAISGGQVHLFDVALRNGGNFVPYLIQLSTGFNLTKAAVCTALGVDYPCESPVAKDPKPVGSYLLHATVEGRFEGVQVAPAMRAYLLEQKLFVQPGAPVLPFTRGDRVLGILIFQFPTMELMREMMSGVEEQVQVEVTPVRGV